MDYMIIAENFGKKRADGSSRKIGSPTLKPLRIGLEISTLTNRHHAEIGRYAANLLSGLYALCAREEIEITGLYALDRIRKRSRLSTRGHRIPKHPWHTRWMGSWEYDVVHSTGRWLPRAGKMPKVATVHDVFALMGHDFATEAETELQAGLHTSIARHADRIIFVSEATRGGFLERFDFDVRRTDVVHLGVDTRFFTDQTDEYMRLTRQQYVAGEPYMLFLGSLKPNKNLARLVAAYVNSPVRHSFRLAIAGNPKSDNLSSIMPAGAGSVVKQRVSFLNYVPDEDLPALYGAASAVLFPSLSEGFGLPILDAMAANTPVLTSTVSSCAEVAAGCATLVDPLSVDAIGIGLERGVQTASSTLDEARLYARSKTWNKTALRNLAVYR